VFFFAVIVASALLLSEIVSLRLKNLEGFSWISVSSPYDWEKR
jgi:hypothetical protein